jgi:hypothetical protein
MTDDLTTAADIARSATINLPMHGILLEREDYNSTPVARAIFETANELVYAGWLLRRFAADVAGDPFDPIFDEGSPRGALAIPFIAATSPQGTGGVI